MKSFLASYVQCSLVNLKRKEVKQMKKLILLVAVMSMVVFVSGTMAQQKAAPAPAKPMSTAPAPEKPMKMEKFSGMVEKVDEAAKMVDVKRGKKTMSFALDDQTKITKAGKEMALADVKKGMNVAVEYKKEGDKMIATAVKASAPKAVKKAKPAAKPAETPATPPAAAPTEAPKK